MSKVCQVTGKSPQAGNHVSHAKNRVKRKFFPNLHSHRFWVESENRFVTLKVSAKGMRVIDKKGIEELALQCSNFERRAELASCAWCFLLGAGGRVGRGRVSFAAAQRIFAGCSARDGLRGTWPLLDVGRADRPNGGLRSVRTLGIGRTPRRHRARRTRQGALTHGRLPHTALARA